MRGLIIEYIRFNNMKKSIKGRVWQYGNERIWFSSGLFFFIVFCFIKFNIRMFDCRILSGMLVYFVVMMYVMKKFVCVNIGMRKRCYV